MIQVILESPLIPAQFTCLPPVPEDSFPAQAVPSTARWTVARRSFLVATRTSASLLFTLKYQPVQIVENPEE